MSPPRLLTEEEIRAVYRETGGWQADGPEPDEEDYELFSVLGAELDTVCENVAGGRMARLIAAAPDLAHTALEAMRRERILMRALLDPDLCPYCGHEDCMMGVEALGLDGSRWCLTHAPAGSVRVVP